jgi:lipopolysaccharide transport system permease protein
MMEASGTTSRTTLIEPPRSKWLPDFRELWDRRELMYYMARRDISVRYKQAIVGFTWSIMQPLMFAAVFGVFFGLLAKIEGPTTIPYPLFAASGLVLWVTFSDGLGVVSLSTLQASALISKIYFPRLVIPIASLAPKIVDLVIGFLVMIPIAWGFGFEPRPHLVLFPLCLVLTFAITLGAGLWFAALNVRYRDVNVIVPFVILIGLFISPIIYPIDYVPEELRPLYVLNPVSGVMELWRYMLLPVPFDPMLLLISAGSGIVILISGLMYFTRVEPGFADVI